MYFTESHTQEIRLTSEFADVRVRHDDTANGCRVRITDLRTGNDVFLDALEVEALCRMPRGALLSYLVAVDDRVASGWAVTPE